MDRGPLTRFPARSHQLRERLSRPSGRSAPVRCALLSKPEPSSLPRVYRKPSSTPRVFRGGSPAPRDGRQTWRGVSSAVKLTRCWSVSAGHAGSAQSNRSGKPTPRGDLGNFLRSPRASLQKYNFILRADCHEKGGGGWELVGKRLEIPPPALKLNGRPLLLHALSVTLTYPTRLL